MYFLYVYKQLLLLYAYIMPRAKFNTCRDNRDISQDASFPDRAWLGATKHLYNWLFPSVGRSVCLSVTHL